jgi:PKD repeat protein
VTLHTIRRFAPVAALAALTATACTVNKQTAPSDLIGPAEFGLSVNATADRDSLPRDGASQTGITVATFDSTGKPVAQRLRLSFGSGTPAGTGLSTTELVTGANGATSFVVTAPPRTSPGDLITVALVPIAGEAVNGVERLVSINLTPSNPNAPVPSFTFSPAGPVAGDAVTFDATGSTDEGSACGACSYAWDFGDGSTGSGIVTGHTFTSTGNKIVTLTVTDVIGAGRSTTRTAVVAASAPPTASISVSPTGSRPAGTVLNFDGSASAAVAVGASIVEYTWIWGDGSANGSGAQATHAFGAAGSYVVRLTVRDSLGRTATATIAITVT